MPKTVIKPYHRDFICTMLAEYKTVKEISNEVLKKYKLSLWPNQISWIKKKHSELINHTRALYLKDLMEIPIAQKRIRLERTDEQYAEADNIAGLRSKIDTKLKCLARSQEEMEGKTKLGDTFLSFQQNNMFSGMTDSEILKERSKILSRIKNIKIPKVLEVNDAKE